ncbi:ATP-binding protein [Streptomyces badius]|uniref:ATP-binding protein n=3 Tax=Streptomyces TaxID=1883 RepID=A0ABQ2TQR3_STRBA|nr:ATP-binding protein [Streptomyces badius]
MLDCLWHMPRAFRGPRCSGVRIPSERPRKVMCAAMMVGMAGLEGVDQPRPRSSATAARSSSITDDEQAFKVLELFGNPTEGEVRLPSRPESAATARRLTSCVVLRQWALSPQTAEYAVLLVSELVGNAVRHTGARVFGLRMVRRRGWIRVEVRDPSRGLPCLMPVREMDVSGRGLFLVDKLSDRWGVDLLPRGKTTWFEMRISDR